MNTSWRERKSEIFVAALLLWGATLTAFAADPKPDHRIVLRVSSAMLNSSMDGKDLVNRESDVQEQMLGTTVIGKAKVTGTPVVKLIESGDSAKFQIILEGTAVSHTTGYNGPAIVTSRSTTKFTATKLVVFEPTRGFYGQPAKVNATTQTTIENIDSTRGGIIGRIVRRRAAAIEAGQHGQFEQIAAQRAERRIQLAFEKTAAHRLAKLNEVADVRSLASATGHSHSPMDIKYSCCTTPHYFQIATSFSDSGPPLELPKYDPNNPHNAPVEVWVHDTFIGEPIATGIDLLAKQAETNKLALTISAVARTLGSAEFTDKIPTVIGRQTLHMHKIGHWRVAKVEIPAPDLAEVVQVLRPVSAPSKPAVLPKVTVDVADANRTWTSGKYTAEAKFVGIDGKTVKLQRTTGVNTTIPLEKLSDADQAWIKEYLAKAPRTASN
ncbi:SHD1 domain-containing protein [Anatilimnocola floriformis]|uniref:SHD1 domain-containing protein n=1 Tax=Anatilimnocola floriformis TaxID=2948575 RepID=UPI0020C2214D|nr:SHD1 domain-containing protein [Anatilimnocola floriformis]